MEEGPEEDFSQDENDYLEARIENISVSNLGFIVFLKAAGDHRVLPIFIGANEAQSIAIAYNGQIPPRPLTHDLMKNMLGLLDVEIIKVQVTSLSENTFFGRVHLRKEGIEDMDIDARPSDAIALALRYKAPIFVHKDVYESAAIVIKDGEQAEAGEQGGEEAGSGEAGAEASAGGIAPGPGSGAGGTGKPAQPETHMSQVERLKKKLAKALKAERYEEAARIRDELKRFGDGN